MIDVFSLAESTKIGTSSSLASVELPVGERKHFAVGRPRIFMRAPTLASCKMFGGKTLARSRGSYSGQRTANSQEEEREKIQCRKLVSICRSIGRLTTRLSAAVSAGASRHFHGPIGIVLLFRGRPTRPPLAAAGRACLRKEFNRPNGAPA